MPCSAETRGARGSIQHMGEAADTCRRSDRFCAECAESIYRDFVEDKYSHLISECLSLLSGDAQNIIVSVVTGERSSGDKALAPATASQRIKLKHSIAKRRANQHARGLHHYARRQLFLHINIISLKIIHLAVLLKVRVTSSH